MANRFQELFRLSPKLFIVGSPIMIEAGALQKDTTTSKVLVQLKLRNLSNKYIVECKVKISAYELNGTEVEGVPIFSYLDIYVALGGEFGSKVPIPLPNNCTRKFSAAVTEAIFSDGSIWNAAPCEWEQVPVQETIVERLSDLELKKQYELEVGSECAFVPVIQRGLFQCTCGTINLENAIQCYKCKRKSETLVSALDIDSLTRKKDDRVKRENEEREAAEKLAAEKAEKARSEAEKARSEAEAKKERNRKLLKIIIPIIAVMAIIAALSPTVIKPAIDYHYANKLLSEGSFDDAKAAFEALGDYRNSADMALESQYRKADLLASDGKYENAIAGFKALGNYKDSGDLYISSSYTYACQLTDSNDYKNAIDYFGFAKGYKDADDLKTDSIYNYACQLLNNKDYVNSIIQFGNCSGYKDTASKLMDAKYGYVVDHKSRTDPITSQYLDDLLVTNYSGAQSIYDEIYFWKLTVTAVNTSLESDANMTLISKYSPVYFHFKISGGPPDGSTTLSYKYTFSDGSTGSHQFNTIYYNGDTDCYFWENGFWTDPLNSPNGTLSLEFYDDKGNMIGSRSVVLAD